ncbi:MAG: hypothetical protein R3A11_09955 [Bdellovibrionota bacterium]
MSYERLLDPRIQQHPALDSQQRFELVCSLPSLSSAFFSPLHQGQLVEWGIPYGKNGRWIPLSFFRMSTCSVAWIYDHEGVKVYPPAWEAFGIDLEKFFFVESKQVFQDVKPVFLCGAFPIIVLDVSTRVSLKEMAFLKQKSIQHKKIIFLIHPFWMRHEIGNPYAQVRINVFFHPLKDQFSLDVFKGGKKENLFISSQEVFQHEYHF